MKNSYLKLITIVSLIILALGMTACGNSIDNSASEEDMVITVGDKTIPLTATWTELQGLASEYGWTLDDSLSPGSLKDRSFETAYNTNGEIHTEHGTLNIQLMANEDYTDAILKSVSLSPENIDTKNANILGITTQTNRKDIEKNFQIISDSTICSYKADEYVTLNIVYSTDEKENRVAIERTPLNERGTPIKVNLPQYVTDTYPDVSIGEKLTYANAGISGETVDIGNNTTVTLGEDWVFETKDLRYSIYRYKGNKTTGSLSLLIYDAIGNMGNPMTEVEFADYLKNKIDLICGSVELTENRITSLSDITINGYTGYCIDTETANDSNDSTQIYLYADGFVYSFTIAYSNELTDAAIKEEGIQAAIDAISTITLN